MIPATIELHLPVEAKEKLSEYIESKSLPVEVKHLGKRKLCNRKFQIWNALVARASRQILINIVA